MNKLAPIALFLLLFFGGSLWYLANSELNANVQARIIKVSNYYTDQLLSIEKVEINLTEGTGKIYGIKLQNNALFQKRYMLEVPQLNFAFDAKSVTGKVIIINEITLNDGQFFIENIEDQAGNRQSNFSQLYQRLNDKISLIQDRRKQKSEPYIQASNIKILNSLESYLPLDDDQQKNIPQRNSYTLNAIGKGEGLPASLFGIEVLRKTLETIISTQTAITTK